jgi:flagellar biosynthetic protein FliP
MAAHGLPYAKDAKETQRTQKINLMNSFRVLRGSFATFAYGSFKPLLVIGLTLVAGADVLAQTTPFGFTAQTSGNTTTYSVPIQTLLIFGALSFLPAVLLLMTSFTRLIIVLGLLRQALGLQSSPPNQVLVGLSLFLTFFIMGPTLEKIHDQAYKPFSEQKISFEEAVQRGSDPLRAFMLKQTREGDLALFNRIANRPAGGTAEETPMRILVPAFVTSELKTAFQIGFMVFVPFIVIDLVVASVLMSMGMMMLSPVLIALPFKLMLFVLADGWNLLIGSLVASFGGAS